MKGYKRVLGSESIILTKSFLVKNTKNCTDQFFSICFLQENLNYTMYGAEDSLDYF